MTTTTSIILTALFFMVITICTPVKKISPPARTATYVVFNVSLCAVFLSVIAKFWGVR